MDGLDPIHFLCSFCKLYEWIYLWMNWMDKWFDLSRLNIIKKLRNEILCVSMFAPPKILSRFHCYVYDSVTWISQPLAHHLHQCTIIQFSEKLKCVYVKTNKNNQIEKIPKPYLTNSDISPVYPSKAWKAEPIIIAPWSSFIICLNFCKLINKFHHLFFPIIHKLPTNE